MFTRVSATDLIVYQALVDALAADIEKALPAKDVVFGYRQSVEPGADPFAGTPGREAYTERLRHIVDWGFSDRYAIVGDIAGYYTSVDIDELERLLLEVSSRALVVRDLCALLRAWEGLGVRGLPQGLPPSGPLGNLYLRPLDETLASLALPYVRWMDDFVVATPSYHDARRVLDALEAALYPVGMSLTAEKTKIRRYDGAYRTTETADDRLQRIKSERRADYDDWLREATAWTDYPPGDGQKRTQKELNQEAVVEVFNRLSASVTDEELPKQFEADAIATFRELVALNADAPVDAVPTFVERVPSATADVLAFTCSVAKRHADAAGRAFTAVFERWPYLRELERLQVCAAALRMPEGTVASLADAFGLHALQDEHPVVRARALLAWGRLAATDDFAVADGYWRTASFSWRPYALAAIQKHDRTGRDDRYERWSTDGTFLASMATSLTATPIGWRKL